MRKGIIGIYRITSPSNKVYIGQSVDIRNRFSKYRNGNCKEQPLLYNSIKKHGWDAHTFEILEQCTKEELDGLECKYIEMYGAFNSSNGLNCHTGGLNHEVSDRTRELSIRSNKGGGVGIKKSELHIERIRQGAKERWKNKEERSAISAKLKGTAPWNTGLKHSEETKIKISEGMRRRNALLSELEKPIQNGQ